MQFSSLFKRTALGFAVLASCSFFLPTPVKADGNLIFVGKDSKNYKYYLDRDWLKAEDHGFIDYVYTVRLPEPDSSGILLVDFHAKGHCATSRVALKSIQLYNVSDKLVDAKQFDSLTFDIVQPNTPQQVVLDAACRVINTQ